MKIALIQSTKSSLPKDANFDIGMLGLLSIATYLKKYGNFDNITLVDASFENPVKKIKKIKPDVIGVAALTYSIKSATSFAQKIKETFDIPIILGGIHISSFPSALPEIFDVGVLGEGEQTMLELMNEYEKTGGLKNKNINGLVFRNNKNIVITKNRNLIEPIDNIPIPDRSFLPKIYYKPKPDWSGKRLIRSAIMTSRGCPYKCRFCASTRFWKKIRFHSAKYVVDHIEELHSKYRVQKINIVDDLFIANKNRLFKIYELMKERGLNDKIEFFSTGRSNLISNELCEILKKIGVTTLDFGFESGNERVLKFLKKGTVTVEDHKKAVNICVRHDLKVRGSIMLGNPTETIEEMKDSLDFMDWVFDHGGKAIWFFISSPHPNTEFWDIAKRRNMVSEDMDWDKLNYRNPKEALLLDETIDKNEFEGILLLAKKRRLKFDTNNKIWFSRTFLENLKTLISENQSKTFRIKLLFNVFKSELFLRFLKRRRRY